MEKKRIIGSTIGTIVIVLLLCVALLATKYNSFVKLNEQVSQAYSQVDNVIQRRADLIPNLVESVKGYANHESETLQNIVEARAGVKKADTPQELAQADAELSRSINVMIEAYPELKSDKLFTQLMDELAGAENRISVERKNYNGAVQKFNTGIKRFPGNIIANMTGFTEKPYFEADESAKTVPSVNFNK